MPLIRNTLVLAILFFFHAAPVYAVNSTADPMFDRLQHLGLSGEEPLSRLPQTDQNQLYLPIIYKPEEPTSDLLDGWYLMVDDGHIVYRNVHRAYHQFQKYPYNPIMRADKPWEGGAIQLYGTVLPNFRMWYSSYNHETHYTQVLYAESPDGLNWVKPNLDGNGRNTMFGGQYANMVSVIYNPHDIDRLYKLMAYQSSGFYGYWSTDGIQTNPYPENPLFWNGNDVAQFYWNPHTLQYRGTAKESKIVRDVRRRVVRFIDSDDFINWLLQPDILEPDTLDDQLAGSLYPHFYGLPVFLIGEQYLGLLWVLEASDLAGQIGKLHVQLVSSHDGMSWIREEGNRPPILNVGPSGSWDDGQIYTATQPLRVGNELWLYYSGCDQEHGVSLQTTVCGIGLAKAAYNRLASLRGSGIVVTDNLILSGTELHLNYDGSQGSIQVELLSNGEIIPGYEAENCLPMSENSQDQIVEWFGQPGLPMGPFQVKFYLDNSAIYAFR